MKIIVQKSKKGWFWKIVSKNGKILAHSEVYTRKKSCIDTVSALMMAKLVVNE